MCAPGLCEIGGGCFGIGGGDALVGSLVFGESGVDMGNVVGDGLVKVGGDEACMYVIG